MSRFKHLVLNKAGILLLIITVISITSCDSNQEKSNVNVNNNALQNEALFVATIQKHLDAVSNKDLTTLKSTLSPEGKMQLILPNSEIINSTINFIEYHKEWFQDTSWTFETKIINTEIGDKIGIAVTEIIYREPDRNGKPYFNRLIVSYGLEKIDDKWYIISDHASSIEKSNI